MNRGEFAVNIPNLIQLLSRHLYPDALACVRELVANAIDASLLGNRGDPVVVSFTPGKSLVVADRGVGISHETITTTLGTIAESTKKTVEGLPIAPNGVFGVGLLSALDVASRVTIESSVGTGEGLRWLWSGGADYEWETVTGTAIGTRVELELASGSRLSEVDDEQLREYLATEFAFAPVTIVLETQSKSRCGPTNSQAPPWRRRSDPKAWAEGLGLTDLLAGVVVEHSGRPGGGAVGLLPTHDRQSSTAPRIYRSGVRLPRGAGIVPDEFRWLVLLIDLPGAPTDLAKHGFAGASLVELRLELVALLDGLVCELLKKLGLLSLPSAWWTAHRAEFIRLLARMRERGSLAAKQQGLLANCLPFATQRGDLTIAKMAQEPSFEFHVDFDGPDDHGLFEWLRTDHALRAVPRELVDAGVAERSGIQELRAALEACLAPLDIAVRTSDTVGLPGILACWGVAPGWAFPEPVRSRPSSRSQSGPVLLLNAESALVDQLGRKLGNQSIRAAGFLLLEWATAHARSDMLSCERINRSLFDLIDERHPPDIGAARSRVFVAYDWSDERELFPAVHAAFDPRHVEVLRASDEARAEFVLENVRKIMLSCHIVVSVFTYRKTAGHVTPSVLMEAGMASSMPGRPHFLCVHTEVEIPTNYDGVIRVEFSSMDQLRDKLREAVTKHGLQRGST